jgi:hypothetical protein
MKRLTFKLPDSHNNFKRIFSKENNERLSTLQNRPTSKALKFNQLIPKIIITASYFVVLKNYLWFKSIKKQK